MTPKPFFSRNWPKFCLSAYMELWLGTHFWGIGVVSMFSSVWWKQNYESWMFRDFCLGFETGTFLKYWICYSFILLFYLKRYSLCKTKCSATNINTSTSSPFCSKGSSRYYNFRGREVGCGVDGRMERRREKGKEKERTLTSEKDI